MSRDHEHGGISLEALILAPGMMLILVLVIVGGHIGLATVAMDAAAQNGARAASIERTPASARTAATSAVNSTLDQHGLECSTRATDIDVAAVGKQAGQHGAVHVHVRCTVAMTPLPGSRVVESRASSAVDTYRQSHR